MNIYCGRLNIEQHQIFFLKELVFISYYLIIYDSADFDTFSSMMIMRKLLIDSLI